MLDQARGQGTGRHRDSDGVLKLAHAVIIYVVFRS